MATTNVTYIYAAEDTTGFSVWDSTLSRFVAQARRRARVIKLTETTAPVMDDEKVQGLTGFLVPTGDRPVTPWIPVVWPRGASFDTVWARLDEVVVMGIAAAGRHLSVHAYGAGDSKADLLAAGAIVTALRLGVACTMHVVPVNVDLVSKYTVQSRDDELILHVAGANAAEQEQIRAHRAIRKELDGNFPAWRAVACLGPFVLLVASLSRGVAAQAAMAAMYGRLLDKRLSELLPEGFRRAYQLDWVRSAVIEEVWRGFPSDIGDMIQLDYMAQELALRATTDDLAEHRALKERIASYVRVRSQPATRSTVRNIGHARIERVAVPDDVVTVYEDDVSEEGMATGTATPYSELSRTPPDTPRRVPSPIRIPGTPMAQLPAYTPPVLPDGVRDEVFAAMRSQYVAQQDAQRAHSPVPVARAATPPPAGI